jgi:GH15 family glucan-1,4-alpha-glucosidase
MMAGVDLGVIGNCAIGALVDSWGRMVWSCFPQFDGDPVFCRLLTPRQDAPAEDAADSGHFTIELLNQTRAEQQYLDNTAVLVTRLSDGQGNAVEITDFAPRFARYERMFRPPMIVRRVAALSGHPRIRVRLRPRFGHGALAPVVTRGSNHLRYVSPSLTLRHTTNAPISYIRDEIPFLLDGQVDMLFGDDEAVTGGIEHTARDFYERTCDNWRNWVRALVIPYEWQEAVIRAAITLKMCNFEETGAIIAALTTSLPEAPGTTRNWDYRFCWLRDAYFVVHALNGLGVTRTMEEYLNYIANIAGEVEEHGLQPVYSITRNSDLSEWESPDLAGYRGHGPVRFGNQAHQQVQNDVYGSVVLASTQLFFDRRLVRSGNRALFEQLEMLGRQATRVFDRPDAGPWEFRTMMHLHTFSGVMCWSACDRLAKIAVSLGLPDRAREWRQRADRMHAAIVARSWNAQLNSFVAFSDGEEIDATLLLLHELDFLAADDPRFAGTVAAVERHLKQDGFLYRYRHPDDFGLPHTAFIVCTFWYIDALAALGRKDEARAMFERVLKHRNTLGLLSEDLDVASGELWGNFPQTYSMVGLINSAKRLSRSWEDAL